MTGPGARFPCRSAQRREYAVALISSCAPLCRPGPAGRSLSGASGDILFRPLAALGTVLLLSARSTTFTRVLEDGRFIKHTLQ